MNKIILVGLLASFSAGAQTFTEKISRQLSFEKQSTDNALVVANLFGNIHVQSYDGPAIILEVTKTVGAKTEAGMGNGGPLLDFETFNGNVYLKEIK